MACGGCGGNKTTATGDSVTLQASSPVLADGFYRTAADPEDCSGAYDGPYAKPVYVVALGTDVEQFFTRDQRSEAIRLATTSGQTIDQLHPRELCRETVDAVLAG